MYRASSHPDYRWLVAIRKALEEARPPRTIAGIEIPGFPVHGCEQASHAAARYLGHEILHGIHHFIEYPNLKVKLPSEPHYWNLDRERNLWIDLSADQFGPRARALLPRVRIEPAESIPQYEVDTNPNFRVEPLDPNLTATLDRVFATRRNNSTKPTT